MMYDIENRTISKTVSSFYGATIPKSDKDAGYIQYATLANAFDAVLCNNAPVIDPDLYDNLENGEIFTEDGEPLEIFQYYIIDANGADILKNWTDELVFYSEKLDTYVWGVTHWGTAWNCVSTDIKIA